MRLAVITPPDWMHYGNITGLFLSRDRHTVLYIFGSLFCNYCYSVCLQGSYFCHPWGTKCMYLSSLYFGYLSQTAFRFHAPSCVVLTIFMSTQIRNTLSKHFFCERSAINFNSREQAWYTFCQCSID